MPSSSRASPHGEVQAMPLRLALDGAAASAIDVHFMRLSVARMRGIQNRGFWLNGQLRFGKP